MSLEKESILIIFHQLKLSSIIVRQMYSLTFCMFIYKLQTCEIFCKVNMLLINIILVELEVFVVYYYKNIVIHVSNMFTPTIRLICLSIWMIKNSHNQ